MKFWFLFILPFLLPAQNKFDLATENQTAAIPFKFINNMIIVKTEVNGKMMNMIFDTGVKETILINLKSPDSLNLKGVKKLYFAGVGNENIKIAALSSVHNKVNLQNKLVNNDALIYIVTGVEFHFSENTGININGFIGGDLIKDFIVQIDYKKKLLRFYRHSDFDKKLLKKYKSYPLEIIRDKPYVYAFVKASKNCPQADSLKLLIDTGNGDAVWFFSKRKIKLPANQKTVTDYFGLGFSGKITGQRAKMYRFGFDDKFRFKNVYAGLPDSIYFTHIVRNNPFDGLLGNEILRRFFIFLDYRGKTVYLKKYRRNYRNRFLFNDTGLYLSYEGKIPVKVKMLVTNFETDYNKGAIEIFREESYIYRYRLVDKIVISYIRKDSPADRAGLMKGDVLLEINGNDVYRYRLDELEKHYFYHNNKYLEFTVKRKGMILQFKVFNTSQL